MKGNKDQPVPTDTDLFRNALDGVVPIAPSSRAANLPPPKPPRSSLPSAPGKIPDTLSDHGAEDALLTEFLRPGMSPMTLRKLRRGQWPVQDSLDLHGLRSEEARQLLLEFLHNATQHNLRCVSIIHGKGRHTGGEGILKNRARQWLTQCPPVLAFCEAPPPEGGSGAVKVLLKINPAGP